MERGSGKEWESPIAMKLVTGNLRALTVTGGARLAVVESECDRPGAAWGSPLLTSSSSVFRRRFSRRRASSCTEFAVHIAISLHTLKGNDRMDSLGDGEGGG